MAVITINKQSPEIDSSCWIADNATITGSVRIDAMSSVWYNAVIRGDVNNISIGQNVNIQDLSMIHGSHGGVDTIIEDNVTIGHRAIIHGCWIQSSCLIGMGAIILDEAVISKGTLVGAGAVIKEGTVTESGYLYAGIPAKKIKKLDDNFINWLQEESVNHYVTMAQNYKSQSS